jgi:hypothetical protein
MGIQPGTAGARSRVRPSTTSPAHLAWPGGCSTTRRAWRAVWAGREKIRSRSRLGSHRRAGSVVKASSWVQAVMSPARATTACQIRFWSCPCGGRLRRPVSLAARMRSSTRARQRWRSFEVGELPARAAGGGVGGKRGVAVPVGVGQAQLRPGMWPFAADDHAHALRPARQRHRRAARRARRPGPGSGRTDRVRQALVVQPVQQLMRGAGAVDPHEDLPAGPVPGPIGRELTQRGADHRDVIGGGVASRVPGPQQRRQRFPGPGRAVVDQRPQRVMPESALVDGAAPSFSEWAVTKVASTSMISGRPASIWWSGAWSPARTQAPARACARAASIAANTAGASAASGRSCVTPSDRRRPDRTPQLGAQHRDIGQAVSADRETQREVLQHLRRVVHRQPGPPRRQRCRQVLTELDPGDGLGQQDRAGGDTTWVPAVSRSGAG